MPECAPRVNGVLILADESAEWKVAGLRQLDRLALALNDYVSRSQGIDVLPVCVCWIGNKSGESSRQPQDRRLTHLMMSDNVDEFFMRMRGNDASALVVSTRLVLARDTLAQAFEKSLVDRTMPMLLMRGDALAGEGNIQADSSLVRRLRATELIASQQPGDKTNRDWTYLQSREGIAIAEKRLMQNTGKSQDGFAARFINRPISRSVSRWLVRFPLLPNQWTLMVTAIPIAGSILLMRGDYLGFACGAVLFQLHSVLDGCDGEIARLKYLESEKGRRLDTICDRLVTLIFVISIGVGLSRQPGIPDTLRWLYLLEAAITALLIGVSEFVLMRAKADEGHGLGAIKDDLYPHYVRAIRNSGVLRLGAGVTSFFVEVTKRDTYIFGFMVLALCGRPTWILHILAVCACAMMLFTRRNLAPSSSPADRARVQ